MNTLRQKIESITSKTIEQHEDYRIAAQLSPQIIDALLAAFAEAIRTEVFTPLRDEFARGATQDEAKRRIDEVAANLLKLIGETKRESDPMGKF